MDSSWQLHSTFGVHKLEVTTIHKSPNLLEGKRTLLMGDKGLLRFLIAFLQTERRKQSEQPTVKAGGSAIIQDLGKQSTIRSWHGIGTRLQQLLETVSVIYH